jgi:ABC-2 type transport system permease protein
MGLNLYQYWDIFRTSARNNIVREFFYRANFIAMTLVDFTWAIVEALFFHIIYSNTAALNGWTREQGFFFLGLFLASDAIFSVFFQRNFWYLPGAINNGELDTVLIRPANPIFLLLTRSISFTQITNFILGIFILQRYGTSAGFQGGWHWIAIIGWILFGVLIQALVRLAFVLTAFWIERGYTVSSLYYSFFQLGARPDLFYPTAIRYALKSALPFAFIASVPAQFLVGTGRRGDLLLMASVVIGYLVLNRWLWKKGLRRYQSASS